MPVESPVSADHPLMKAWNAYRASDDYANTLKWAVQVPHTEGSLWAAFSQGWRAARTDGDPEMAERIAAIEREVALIKKKSLTPDEAREVMGLPSGEGEPPT